MFTQKRTWLDEEIVRTDRKLRASIFGSEEYVKLFQFRLQLEEIQKKNSNPISKETLVLAGTNLLGIILILKHEWLNPINSKAMGLLMRVR